MSLADRIRKAVSNGVKNATKRRVNKWMSTGIPPLDHALSGGWERGVLVEIYGESTVGKSLMMDLGLIQNQREGGVSVKFPMEGAHNPEFFGQLGGNDEQLVLYPDLRNDDSPEDVFLEDVVLKMEEFMLMKLGPEASEESLVMGWDSIASTLPKAVEDVDVDALNMKHHLARAVALSECCPRLVRLAQKTGSVILSTNQIREDPSPFAKGGGITRPGGRSYPFYASQWVELKKGAAIKADNGEKIGHWIKGEVTKNRLGPAHKTFMLPVYTRTEFGHPIYEGPMLPGIHLVEAMWEFYLGRKSGKDDEKAKIVPYFLLPDGQSVIQPSDRKGYFKLHPILGSDESFRKAEWPKIMEAHPELWTLAKREVPNAPEGCASECPEEGADEQDKQPKPRRGRRPRSQAAE